MSALDAAWEAEWNRACKALGVPPDRAALVRRNVELKGAHAARGKAMRMLADVFHEVFQHSGPLDSCESSACVGNRQLIADTDC